VAGLNYETLTPTEKASYYSALGAPTQQSGIRVTVLNLDHVFQADVSNDVTADGSSVTLDRNNDVERSANVTVIDLTGMVADLDLRHLMRVEHGIYTPALGDWVWTKTITGRVMVPADTGDVSKVELHGKESFGLMPGAPTRVWPKGKPVAAAIRDMHADIGETKFRIAADLLGDAGPKLDNPVHSGGADEEKAPTRVSRRIANKASLQVFYDAEGYLVVRRPPQTPLAVWSEDDEDDHASVTPLTSRIDWARDLREVRNTVRAKGKKNLTYTASAPPDHIFSPDSLARGGILGRLVHYWTDTTISRMTELQAGAERTLTELLTEKTNATMRVVPVFHVGPQDLIEARRRDGKWGQWFMQEASIPLGMGEDMTVGYLPNVKGRVR
jgi:hypothetical protein